MDYYLNLTKDYDSLQIDHNLNFILDDFDLFFKILEIHLNHASNDNSNYKNIVIRHTHEIFNIENLNKVSVLYGDILIEKIKSFGFEKLIFLDNNLIDYSLDSGILHKGYPFFLGMTHPYSLRLGNRKFKKNFICLNNRETEHRIKILEFLYNSKIEKKTILSHSFDVLDKNKIEILIDTPENKINEQIWSSTSYKPILLNYDSFCNIVTETNYYRNDIKFITEKTEKCFSSGQPFVMVSSYKFLENLKSLGYKTFSNWWDESYDDEIDNDKRLHKINQLIQHISNFSDEDMKLIYKEMTPTLIHNKKINRKWFIKNAQYGL